MAAEPMTSIGSAVLRIGVAALLGALLGGGCDCAADPPGGDDEDGGGEGEGEQTAGAPTVVVQSPTDGATFSRGETITFTCAATDAEDGAVENGAIVWSTDVDGQIGIGATILTALSTAGARVVTCAATDSEGNTGRAAIGIEVLGNQVPVVTIASPADGAFVKTGATVSFVGGALDPEDGAIQNGALRWLDGTAQLGVGATVQTAFAQQGDHVVTLLATDGSGGVGAKSVTVRVVDNLPPVCTISSPNENQTILVGASVSFNSSCTDPDGTIAIGNGAYAWSSDVQGALGVGQNVATALVTAGAHTITVCADDTVEPAIQGCAVVHVVVAPNQPPAVPVVTPVTGATFAACVPIALSCSATDPEGQPLTYEWQDSVEGSIGQGANIAWTPDAGGQHTVTCTARDGAGAVSATSAMLTVDALTVTLVTPAQSAIFRPANAISFTGGACSAAVGTLSGAQLSWSSDRDGALGTGAVLSRTLTAGPHVITLLANDGSTSGQDTASIWVNTPPQVAITAPTGGTTVNVGANVTFTGTATDAEDNPDPTPQWIDSAAGALGTGGAVSTQALAVGKHTVALVATDLAGETARATITITVVDPAGPPLTERVAAGAVVLGSAYDAASDTLWVVVEGDGLLRVDASAFTVQDTYADITGEPPRSVALLAGGALAVGTDNGVALACNAADPSVCARTIPSDLDDAVGDQVQAIAQLPDGRTLLGTDQCWLFSDWPNDQHRAYCDGDGGGDGMNGDDVSEIVVDAARGQAWLIANGRATLLAPAPAPEVRGQNAQTFTTYDSDSGLPSGTVRSVAVAPSGAVWFATDLGLARLVGLQAVEQITTFQFGQGLPSNDVESVAIDVVSIGGASREVAWAATVGGLGRVDASVPSVVSITTADGLATNDLTSVVIGGAHEKLLGTPDGIVVYRGL